MNSSSFPGPWKPKRGPGRRGIFYVTRLLDNKGAREFVRHANARPVVYRSIEEAEAAAIQATKKSTS